MIRDFEENPCVFGKPVNHQIRRALCTFTFSGDGGFIAHPQMLFRPSGLLIWGSPPMADVETMRVGNMQQLSVSHGHLPARFFSMAQSLEQIVELLEKGIEPPSWGDFDTAEVGNTLVVLVRSQQGKVLGPDDGVELCMWGKAVRPW